MFWPNFSNYNDTHAYVKVWWISAQQPLWLGTAKKIQKNYRETTQRHNMLDAQAVRVVHMMWMIEREICTPYTQTKDFANTWSLQLLLNFVPHINQRHQLQTVGQTRHTAAVCARKKQQGKNFGFRIIVKTRCTIQQYDTYLNNIRDTLLSHLLQCTDRE